jgi:hypothetical protein
MRARFVAVTGPKKMGNQSDEGGRLGVASVRAERESREHGIVGARRSDECLLEAIAHDAQLVRRRGRIVAEEPRVCDVEERVARRRQHAVGQRKLERLDVLSAGEMRAGGIVQVDHGARRQRVRLEVRKRLRRAAQRLCRGLGRLAGATEVLAVIAVYRQIRVDPYRKRRGASIRRGLVRKKRGFLCQPPQLHAIAAREGVTGRRVRELGPIGRRKIAVQPVGRAAHRG